MIDDKVENMEHELEIKESHRHIEMKWKIMVHSVGEGSRKELKNSKIFEDP